MMQPIISEAHGTLVFSPSFPKGYSGPVLPGSQPLSSVGDFGSILVQIFSGSLFDIRYIYLRLFEKMVLHRQEDERLRAQFVLQEGLRYQRNRTSLEIRPEEYNLVWAPGTETVFQFAAGREYHLLHFYFDTDFIRQLVPGFPYGNSVPDEKAIRLIRPGSQDLVNRLLTDPYEEKERHYLFETVVRLLLYDFMVADKRLKTVSGLSEDVIDRVARVQKLILEDLSKHYSIPELAKRARMGKNILVKAYKKFTGTTILQSLREARMQKAALLLASTSLSVNDISIEVGYDSITGFLGAFRKRFGISPSGYREKYSTNE